MIQLCFFNVGYSHQAAGGVQGASWAGRVEKNAQGMEEEQQGGQEDTKSEGRDEHQRTNTYLKYLGTQLW